MRSTEISYSPISPHFRRSDVRNISRAFWIERTCMIGSFTEAIIQWYARRTVMRAHVCTFEFIPGWLHHSFIIRSMIQCASLFCIVICRFSDISSLLSWFSDCQPAVYVVVSSLILVYHRLINLSQRRLLNAIFAYNPLLFNFVLMRTVRSPKGNRYSQINQSFISIEEKALSVNCHDHDQQLRSLSV